jgi:hypothetical protein
MEGFVAVWPRALDGWLVGWLVVWSVVRLVVWLIGMLLSVGYHPNVDLQLGASDNTCAGHRPGAEVPEAVRELEQAYQSKGRDLRAALGSEADFKDMEATAERARLLLDSKRQAAGTTASAAPHS